ncbi:hypothetical protein [Candidatus Collinsella stercoripullorum]|uniref:hypothetical protein n=1 Tax=Candidatus Collinsella stercoripullorum TaxID=2838522 RepID=UPI0022DF8907|nr:hypothetical protein [Candidatus Collinsella stercoripullorum]
MSNDPPASTATAGLRMARAPRISPPSSVKDPERTYTLAHGFHEHSASSTAVPAPMASDEPSSRVTTASSESAPAPSRTSS